MSLIKNSFCVLVFLFFSGISFSQEISWTTFENLDDSMAVKKKPIIVKLETSWCGYCKMMDAKVFENKKVVKRIKDNYYFIRLDGENKKPISFNNQTYEYIPYSSRSGVHQLAKLLGEEEGRLNYPTTVVLNTNYSVNKRIVGYLAKSNFLFWLESSEE